MCGECESDFKAQEIECLTWETCYECGGRGVDGHDCGEDTCCCLNPEENVICPVCEGLGGWDA
jgi:hypothetical protein